MGLTSISPMRLEVAERDLATSPETHRGDIEAAEASWSSPTVTVMPIIEERGFARSVQPAEKHRVFRPAEEVAEDTGERHLGDQKSAGCWEVPNSGPMIF